MNLYWKSLLLLLAACLPASSFAADSLTVSVLIDGRSQLIIQPGQVYWQHFLYSRPGRHLTNLPTLLNAYAWYPQWPDGNDSGAGRSASLPVAATFATNTITLVKELGRGSAVIVQQPDLSNDFTLIVDFNDLADGSATYTIALSGVSVVVPPRLTAQVASIALCWPTESNRLYQLQYAPALAPGAWTDFAPPIRGYGTNAWFIEPVLGEPQRFYRVVPLP